MLAMPVFAMCPAYVFRSVSAAVLEADPSHTSVRNAFACRHHVLTGNAQYTPATSSTPATLSNPSNPQYPSNRHGYGIGPLSADGRSHAGGHPEAVRTP